MKNNIIATQLNVINNKISVIRVGNVDYISLTELLSKVNYIVHTESIKENIVPTLIEEQKKFVYADEADVLNVALFGLTANEWRNKNPELAKYGNIRDYTDLLHLVILSNLENTNAASNKNVK